MKRTKRFKRTKPVKTGRKNAYYTKIKPRLLEIAAWCRDGLTDTQISELLGISYETFRVHKKNHHVFSDILMRTKAVVDIEIENSLYQRAKGSVVKETVQEIKTDEKGKVIFTRTKEIKKEIPPDTTAQIFWLKNRRPAQWRDKQTLEQVGIEDGPIENKIQIEFIKPNKTT
jgi:galactitol-specific phosphotransferase system IIB component